MDEAINESEKRKAKNVMQVNLHKKHQDSNQKKAGTETMY